MRVIYLILSVVMMFGIMRPAQAQEKEEWQKVFWAYQFIPDTLSPKDYLQQLDKIEQQATQLISDLEDEQERKVAQLKRYNGLLWGLGNYILKHDDESLRNVMAQKMNGLDMDSPDLDLLSGTEITNLVNGYLNFYHAGLSDVNKATYVLYNIKSEKVRNEYVADIDVGFETVGIYGRDQGADSGYRFVFQNGRNEKESARVKGLVLSGAVRGIGSGD